MPKNKVSDPITDQEMAFARLVLSGGMTDGRAAEAAGLNPDSAAYIKSKPGVCAYMLEHRAAVQQQLVQQEAEGQLRFNLDREQVLARLRQIANMGPEITRGGITGQVKALSMIVAMQNLIPDRISDRRAALAEKPTPTAPKTAQIYQAEWLAEQQAISIEPQPSPAAAQQEDSPGVPEPELALGWGEEAPPAHGPSKSAMATHLNPSPAQPPTPFVPVLSSVPDAWAPFSIQKNPFDRFL